MTQFRAAVLLAFAGAVLCCVCGCAGTEGSAVVEVAEYERPSVDTSNYRLRIGDEVRIMFPGDRTLDYLAPVSPAGTVGTPSGGEIEAAGKTVDALRRLIEAEMGVLLLDPSASVVLEKVAEQPVYVLGEVFKPGAVMSPATMSLSMAIAEAGGLQSSGKTNSVMVIRTTGVPEAVAIKVDITKVLSGRDLSYDLPLEPYDVVFVPKSVIGKVDEFVDVFFNQIAPAQLFYLRGYDIANRKPLSVYQ